MAAKRGEPLASEFKRYLFLMVSHERSTMQPSIGVTRVRRWVTVSPQEMSEVPAQIGPRGGFFKGRVRGIGRVGASMVLHESGGLSSLTTKRQVDTNG